MFDKTSISRRTIGHRGVDVMFNHNMLRSLGIHSLSNDSPNQGVKSSAEEAKYIQICIRDFRTFKPEFLEKIT